MNFLAWIFRSQSTARKSSNDWKADLANKPDWMLANIVKNPGEFTIEMRQAASEIMSKKITNE